MQLSSPANKNHPQTMTSREMAELTEVRHDSVKRTIDALVARGVVASPQIEEASFTGSDGRKQTVTQYLVGKRDSYVIVARLSPEFTGRLVDRWNELEAQLQVETRTKPKAISSTQAFKGFFQVGKLLGLDRNVCAISANNAVVQLTGTNVLQLMGQTEFHTPNQEQDFTPTALGEMCRPPVSGYLVNKALLAAGLQTKGSESGPAWIPTKEGKRYSRIIDSGKRHNSGSIVQQVKWSVRVLAAAGLEVTKGNFSDTGNSGITQGGAA